MMMLNALQWLACPGTCANSQKNEQHFGF